MKKSSKEYLDIMECLLKAQLEVVQELKRGTSSGIGLSSTYPVARAPRANKRKSQVDIAYDVLKHCGEPQHASEILRLAGERLGISLNRDSLVSALLKKVAQGDRFTKDGKNTFGLVEWGEK